MIFQDQEIAGMQMKQLEILHELDRICKINNLRYTLASGTCLGAVRHKGFIPWDDDIDVYMLWEDVEKLITYRKQFEKKYFLQCKKTDPEFSSSHVRLCDSTTSCFLKDDIGLNLNHGLFIDIYILYPYPDNPIKAHKLILDSFIYRILIAERVPYNHGTFAKIIAHMILKFYQGEKRKNKINRVLKNYQNNGGKNKVATYFGEDIGLFHAITYDREWFQTPRYLPFEDMMIACPGEPEEYCELRYGDFMKMPPKEEQMPHHDFVYASTTEPYSNYKNIYY